MGGYRWLSERVSLNEDCNMANRVIDLMGQKFGRLTVVGRAEKVGTNTSIRWQCICDCGKEHSAVGCFLRKGIIQSCGCLRNEKVSERFKGHGLKDTPEWRNWQSMKNRAKRRNLFVCQEWLDSFEIFLADVGHRPLKEMELVVIDVEKGFVPGNVKWGSRRDNQLQRKSTVYFEINGEEKVIKDWADLYGVPVDRVRSRIQKGWKIEDALTAAVQEQKEPELHGLSNLPEYKIWRGIIERCKPGGNYGKKGITVCQEWQDSFLAFYNHVGSRPSPKHQLDRILGGNSSYAIGNVRWVTAKENSRNRTSNRLIEFQGETKCLAEWAEIAGIKPGTLSSRLRYGWTVERALTTPFIEPKKKLNRSLEPDATDRGINFKTHGLSNTPEYRLWAGMLYRCKKDKSYRERDIQVCEEWKNDFMNFYNYLLETIGLRPTPKHQIDRTAGGSSWYTPGNIRWVTNKENSVNRTDNVFWEFKGERLTISQWGEKLGIKSSTLVARIQRGWTLEKTLTTALR